VSPVVKVSRKLLLDARKTGMAVLGILAQVAALGLLPAPYDKWAPIIVAIATALGVYAVQDQRPTPRAGATHDPRDYPSGAPRN
jgi:hypothetical protein